jgi:hypothetical protein
MASDAHITDATAVLRQLIDLNELHIMVQCSLHGDEFASLSGERCHEALVTAEQLGWDRRRAI